MYLIDYHTHSHNSFDGYITVDKIASRAVERGIRELCVTDHYECSDLRTPMAYDFEKSEAEIHEARERYGDKIKLLYGAELGQMHFEPELCKLLCARTKLDFVIGSMHNLKNDLDLYFVEFNEENTKPLFEEYLSELYALASTADYDVLGHITYPLRYIKRDGQWVDIKDYADNIDEILKAVIERGRGIEVNTSGLSGQLGDTMPPYDVIKRYRELGGEIITVGSDAHKRVHVGAGIEEAMGMLIRAGFQYITTFEQRKPSFVKIEE
ncbi:MAG: histidinol-phosphatase HisJ family protein [Clostridia bacterium]|nr:histidinol-phosphatase HisJ family protein [Clostridia bacterium]MBQ1435573.1 histidinol-phosphatase HisJ family protein [Clostridia bacterium]